jgi:hypothetical protein
MRPGDGFWLLASFVIARLRGGYFACCHCFCLLIAVGISLVEPCALRGQGTTVPRVRDTNVGYIDPAVLGNVLRVRVDAAYDNPRPTLAEFFWSVGPPIGSGPRIPESGVDYQDVQVYGETFLTPNVSAFVELPVRLLNPEQNPNTAGMADMNAGVKLALVAEEELVATFQLRAYAPTGDVDRGLGNGHASLEPALLIYKPLGPRWGFEGELRDWIPIDGTDFAGNIIRYGAGLHYDLVCTETCQIVPVAELVGWTILDGLVSIRQPVGPPMIEDAAGDTIVNAKLGVRWKFNEEFDLYTGYGRPLTGDQWYNDIFRVELRFSY